MKRLFLILAAIAVFGVIADAQGSRNKLIKKIQRDKPVSVADNPGTATAGSSSGKQAVNEAIKAAVAGHENITALTKTPLSDGNLPKVIVNNQGEAFILTTKTNTIKDGGNPDMFAADQSTIFPGAIVYADTYLADGRPTLVGLSYGTVDLTIDFDNGAITEKRGVRNDLSSVRSAINEILRSGQAGYAPGVQFNSVVKSFTSTSKMCLELGMDVKYLNNQVKVDTKTTNSESKIVNVQDFTQKYYTVTVTPYDDQNLYKYFGDVTPEQIKSKLSGKSIALINSVSYGRRIYHFEEYKTSDFSFTGKQSAKASVGGVNISTYGAEDISKSSKSSHDWLFIQGGSSKPAADVANGKSVREAFNSEGSLQIGPSNQGIPIFYTAIFLVNRRAISAKSTGTYTETSYTKLPKSVRWEIKNRANTAGDCIKFKAMYNVVEVTGDVQNGYKYEIIKGSGSGEESYADYIENKYSNNTQKTRTMPTGDIEKCKNKKGQKVKMDNCSVLGPVYYTIRAKTADVKGVKWHEDEAGYFDVSGGSVKVYMNGSALAGGKGVYVHSDTKPMPSGK